MEMFLCHSCLEALHTLRIGGLLRRQQRLAGRQVIAAQRRKLRFAHAVESFRPAAAVAAGAATALELYAAEGAVVQGVQFALQLADLRDGSDPDFNAIWRPSVLLMGWSLEIMHLLHGVRISSRLDGFLYLISGTPGQWRRTAAPAAKPVRHRPARGNRLRRRPRNSRPRCAAPAPGRRRSRAAPPRRAACCSESNLPAPPSALLTLRLG